MEGKLTVDKAKSEPLSRNLFRRSVQVKAILANADHIGDNARVVYNQDVYAMAANETTIGIYTVFALVGRRALVNVASTLEYIEQNHVSPGGQLGISFYVGPHTDTQIGKGLNN